MSIYRTTKQELLILHIAQAHHNHPTADMLYLEVRAADNHISRGTVYRNLEKLCETGNLLRVKVPGADRFDSRLDYHYHMICTSCENVFDAPLSYQSELDRLLTDTSSFKIKRHRTVFEGQCPACTEKSCKQEQIKAYAE